MRTRRFGTGTPRVMLLHGFTQHGGHMEGLARRIGLPALAPDLPGHGPEPHLPATMAEAVERVVEAGAGIDVLVGYSMGGRVAVRAALRMPWLSGLVLVSAGVGLPDEVLGERRAADDRLAAHIEGTDLAEFVDEWMALPMFSGLRALDEEAWDRDRAMRLQGTRSGLAASLRGMGQGVVTRIGDDDLARLDCEVRCVVGALDPAYVAAGEHIAAVVPRGSVHVHPRSGHAVVGEDPGFVARVVGGLLDRP